MCSHQPRWEPIPPGTLLLGVWRHRWFACCLRAPHRSRAALKGLCWGAQAERVPPSLAPPQHWVPESCHLHSCCPLMPWCPSPSLSRGERGHCSGALGEEYGLRGAPQGWSRRKGSLCLRAPRVAGGEALLPAPTSPLLQASPGARVLLGLWSHAWAGCSGTGGGFPPTAGATVLCLPAQRQARVHSALFKLKFIPARVSLVRDTSHPSCLHSKQATCQAATLPQSGTCRGQPLYPGLPSPEPHRDALGWAGYSWRESAQPVPAGPARAKQDRLLGWMWLPCGLGLCWVGPISPPTAPQARQDEGRRIN